VSIGQLREQVSRRSQTSVGGRKKRSAVRPPTDRRRRRPKGEREAIGDRPAMRLGKAENPATLHGQSVAGYRRDRRVISTAGTFVTDARAPTRLSRRTIVPPATLCPHHTGPTA